MKEKELQKELWRKSDEFNNLDKVLGAIRASEAAGDSQAAYGSIASGSSAMFKMKCHSCNKFGHGQKNCPDKKDPSSAKCGFCGGPQKCKMQKCKAFNLKCNNCNMFGHIKSCCTEFTKSRARTDHDKKVSKVDDDMEDDSLNSRRAVSTCYT